MKSGKKILILEKDRLAGLDLQQQLEKDGYSVVRPISLVDAEILISKDKPDLIVAGTEIKKQNIFERVEKYLRKYQLPFIWVGILTKKDAIKAKNGINVIGTFSHPHYISKIAALIVNFFNKKPPIIERKSHVNDVTYF